MMSNVLTENILTDKPNMNKTQYIKILGLIAALATGAVSMIAGDWTTGVGIFAAALSSSTAFSTKQGE